MDKKLIDIDQLIDSKNPNLRKWLPGFILSYFKRVLHEEEVNTFLLTHNDKYGEAFCDAAVEDLGISYNVFGTENIPKTGGCIFAVNHPLGGMDAIVIVSAIQTIRTDIKFIVNDVLMHIDNLKGMFVGVNKLGKNFKASLKKVDETFASDQAVFVFPAGLVSRKKNRKIEDLAWKKTFVTRARKYKKPIVPIFIKGQLSNSFYRLANWRKRLGVKTNIEMFYLVNEFYKLKGKHVPMIFGKPIFVEELNTNPSDTYWASQIKARVYEMENELHHRMQSEL
ncbi:MAG: glycerol acyltransferase [Bacteroidetes bacterium]|jgi:putative hemolysin|nr:glycerol acyltransferase [Bacteroidota bacterium]